MSRLRAKNVFCHGATKRGTETFTARKLHEHNQHKQQADDHMDRKESGNKQPHKREPGKMGHPRRFVKGLPAETLDHKRPT